MSIYERLQEEIPIYDLFDLAGVRYELRDKPCQIRCPFHGVGDRHPSARVYPDTNSMRCFYCSSSWNPVTFWAQVNDWYTAKGKLDIGRAISDLCERYDFESDVTAWEKRFYALRDKFYESPESTIDDKVKLKFYYSWQVSGAIHQLTNEERKSLSDVIIKMWDSLELVDLTSDTWREDLKMWYKSARVKVNATGL